MSVLWKQAWNELTLKNCINMRHLHTKMQLHPDNANIWSRDHLVVHSHVIAHLIAMTVALQQWNIVQSAFPRKNVRVCIVLVISNEKWIRHRAPLFITNRSIEQRCNRVWHEIKIKKMRWEYIDAIPSCQARFRYPAIFDHRCEQGRKCELRGFHHLLF